MPRFFTERKRNCVSLESQQKIYRRLDWLVMTGATQPADNTAQWTPGGVKQ
jgi:hypothetical protein